MSKSNLVVSAAIASAVALGSLAVAPSAMADAGEKEKCYGVAKAGMNDCGGKEHPCAGTSKIDGSADDWIYVSKGVCNKIVGGMTKDEGDTEASEG